MRRFFARLSAGGSSPDRSACTSPDQNGHVSYDDPSPFWNGVAAVSSPSTSITHKSWNAEFVSDPNAWEQQFLAHWRQLKKLISGHLSNPAKAFGEVKNLLGEISNLLIVEINSQPEASIGPLLDHCFNNEIFLRVHEWALTLPLYLVPMCQVLLLQTYEDLVNRSQSPNHCLLVHKPILVPLLRLLRWCRRSAEERRFQLSNVDKYFVQLLNQICTKIADDSTLLDFFFNTQLDSNSSRSHHALTNGNATEIRLNGNHDEEEQPFLVFSLLIPYMYSGEDIGQLARDALLLVMSVSREFDFLAKHVSEDSNFCPVLAGGLSGYFSQLPRCIYTALQITEHDEFHKLNLTTDIEQIIELSQFHRALLFCNAIVQVAHDDIIREIVHFFYDGFLLEVFKPAVLQSDNEELVSKIVYFNLCFETVTEPTLIQALLKILIIAETNVREMNLLEIILSKMHNTEKICRVVLSLLKSLIDLRCEDFMWNSLIRFILPFIPLKPASRRFDVNVSLDAANNFLACIPFCTEDFKELNSDETFEGYLHEAAVSIEETTNLCKNWAFKYDGTKPNSLLNMNTTEELLSTRQPFIRLSSARSSFASTGWNRYFQNRSAHGTQESTMLANDLNTPTEGIPPLNMLGEEEVASCSHADKFDPLLDPCGGHDEMCELNTQYEILSNPHYDYFQFAYEGISESDGSNSRRNSNSNKDEDEEVPKNNSPYNSDSADYKHMSAYAAAICNSNWASAKNSQEFVSHLEALPIPDKSPHKTTLDENVALIESRLQYIKELNLDQNLGNPFKLDLPQKDVTPTHLNGFLSTKDGGFLLTCTDEKGPGIFMESLLNALDQMVDRSFQTNLQLVSVFESLLSFPQPVITSYILFVDAIKSNAILRVTNVLNSLKMRIDAYATATEGFDEMLKRGIRHKVTLAERFEKSERLDSVARRQVTDRSGGSSARAAFRFSHKAIESVDRVTDSSRNKNYAYAAIILSQLAQIFAAYSLQHSATVEYPRTK
ncbi:retinoic acid induced 16-like protein [Ditylenchus destructor]|nr:retinoic acid induced 16-like protein [Ditylenchus destructor]